MSTTLLPAPFAGIDWEALQIALNAWVLAASGLPQSHIQWADQSMGRAPEPAIMMWLQHIDGISRPWTDSVPVVLTVDVTVSSISGSTLTSAAHGMVTGDGPIYPSSTVTLPIPLVTTTPYWAVVIDANTFQLATSFANAMATSPVTVTLSSAGSGVLSFASTADTLRAGQEILQVSRGVKRLLFTLDCYTTVGAGSNVAFAILSRIRDRSALPSLQDILLGANIGLLGCDRVRSVSGHKSVVLFEPRAIMEIHLSATSEDSEYGTIITRVVAEGQPPGPMDGLVIDVSTEPQ